MVPPPIPEGNPNDTFGTFQLLGQRRVDALIRDRIQSHQPPWKRCTSFLDLLIAAGLLRY